MASTGFGAAFRQLRGLFGKGSVVGLGDGQLLARYADSKDEAAFGALVARHGPMVLATCRAVLRNEHDVEDAFQATFLVLARKAHSIQGGDALGGWLHRVAYRASVQASVEARRRRLKEVEAAAMGRTIPTRADPDLELAAILHEEIDRLPERQRLPVVLCDLEGLTSEQAARHLRWTEPSLRHRLADGRKRLKDRLTRRGVMAPAIVALMASEASAAVPPALTRMALSATGGPVSAGAALLTHTLLKGMLMTKLKTASMAALAALALASAGMIAAGAGRPDDPKPAMKPDRPGQADARRALKARRRQAGRDRRGPRARRRPRRQAGRRGEGPWGLRRPSSEPVPDDERAPTAGSPRSGCPTPAAPYNQATSTQYPLARRLRPRLRPGLGRPGLPARPFGRIDDPPRRGRPADRGAGRRPRRPARRRGSGPGPSWSSYADRRDLDPAGSPRPSNGSSGPLAGLWGIRSTTRSRLRPTPTAGSG